MNQLLIVLVVLLPFVCCERNYIHPPAFPNQHQYLLMFRNWMEEYGKVYEPREFIKRFKIWKDNVDMIYDFNMNYNKGFYLAVNMFADLTHEEWSALYLTKVIDPKADEHIEPTANQITPQHSDTKVDWRDHTGVITAVGNQNTCGCSYAWATADAVEAERMITYSTFATVLSKQQINDCSDSFNNNGCNGGSPHNTYDYVEWLGGLCSESAYPYKAKDLACVTTCTVVSKTALAATTHSHVSTNEAALKTAVYNQPIATGIDADNNDFIYYGGNIYDGDCTQTNNHFVLVVGYDVNGSGTKFWIIKNSWGTSWGTSGYMQLIRTDSASDSGKCGIAMLGSYPNM